MNKTPFFTALSLSIVLLASFYFVKTKENSRKKNVFSEVREYKGFAAWELKTMMDPATGEIPIHIREKELAFASTLPSDAFFYTNAKMASSALSWNKRGPINVGGRTRAFAVDASNENVLLAGSASGGMWRSADAGQTWNRTSTLQQHLSVTCLAQDKRINHTNVWYYGSGEAFGASASYPTGYYLGNGVYKSTDGGLTWNVLPATNSGSLVSFDNSFDLVWNVATNKADTVNDVVYSANYAGIYKSLNGGTSWTLAKGTSISASQTSYFTDVAVSNTGIVYATLSSDGSQKGIWRSTDGITFTNITPSNFPNSYNRIVMGIAPSDENQVYFLANTPNFGQPDTNYLGDVEWNSLWKYKYTSGNGTGSGGTWTDLSANLPTTGGPFDKYSAQGSYNMVVRVKPNDTNTVFIGGTNLYRSTNGFKDATHTTFIGGYEEGATLPIVNIYSNHHPDQHVLEFLPSNSNVLYSAHDGGISKTLDNTASTVTWSSLNNGYLTSMFYTIAVDHAVAGNPIIIAGAQDNGSWYTNTTNYNTPWITPRGGDGSYCAIADNQSAFYFSIQNGKMMKSTLDANGNITGFARIDPIGGKNYEFINPYTLDPNNNNTMYLAGGKYLWRNDNLAGIPLVGNWDSISTNWFQFQDSVPTANATITAVAVAKTPANRVYYGTSARRVYRVDNANSTTPIVTDITGAAIAASFPNAYVSSIAIDPYDGNKVMVTFSNYNVYSIFYSTDAGSTWTKVAGNLEQNNGGGGNGPSVKWAEILNVQGKRAYFVGTSTGLYATDTLMGLSTIWIQQGANIIGNAVCHMIDSREADGLVVVATHSHGIYSTNITNTNQLVGIDNNALTKNTFEFNIYPNPIKEHATIIFNLNKPEKVLIKIIDPLGKVIEVVTDRIYQEGKHEINYFRNSKINGIYYFSLQAGSSIQTRKIIID